MDDAEKDDPKKSAKLGDASRKDADFDTTPAEESRKDV
jgi:hypothetical protein